MDSLQRFIPSIYSDADKDGSLAAFIAAFDALHAQLQAATESIPEANQPRKAPLAFQQYIADHFGSPFYFMTEERWQEGAKAENLMLMYTMRGCAPGIAHVVYYLTGIRITLLQDFDYAWELDVSQLGGGTSPTTTGFGSGFGTAFGS